MSYRSQLDYGSFFATFIWPLATLVAPVAAIYPLWKEARRLRSETPLVLALPYLGMAAWMGAVFLCAIFDIKGASFVNMFVELPAAAWACVAVAYARLRFFVPGSKYETSKGTFTAIAVIACVIAIRAAVPDLGE